MLRLYFRFLPFSQCVSNVRDAYLFNVHLNDDGHFGTFGCQNRFLMVFTCLALSVFSTIEEYEHQAIDILFKMEILVVIWFTVEFSGRYVFMPNIFVVL